MPLISYSALNAQNVMSPSGWGYRVGRREGLTVTEERWLINVEGMRELGNHHFPIPSEINDSLVQVSLSNQC